MDNDEGTLEKGGGGLENAEALFEKTKGTLEKDKGILENTKGTLDNTIFYNNSPHNAVIPNGSEESHEG